MGTALCQIFGPDITFPSRGLPLPVLWPPVSHPNFRMLFFLSRSSSPPWCWSSCVPGQGHQNVHLVIFITEPEPMLWEPWMVGREGAEG